MTSTLMQPQTTKHHHHYNGWMSDKRIRLTNSSDSNNNNNGSGHSGLKKAIMKMLVFDDNNKNSGNSKSDKQSLAKLLSNSGSNKSTNMSFLNFFAFNALELSAPASPVLLQQTNSIPPGWLQLSGHPERFLCSIAPAENGVVRKRITGPTDSEAIAYRGISKDIYASKVAPKFLGVCDINGDSYLQLEDLLHGFKDPNVMDIKMGCRTFLESEVATKILRPDLYKKMIAVDPTAPTEEEHQSKAVTKLRYMRFREQLSSSHTKGFRIEALKIKGYSPVTDLKKLQNNSEVDSIISNFMNENKTATKEVIKKLINMRSLIEKSEFFQNHEVVGSSVFLVFDDQRVGVWLIDFAKCRQLPDGIKINHRKPWIPGNCEEGLLHGLDELIKAFEEISK